MDIVSLIGDLPAGARTLIILVSIIGGFVIQWKASRPIKEAAQEAAQLSRPTGNGFAQLTKDELRDIKGTVQRVDERTLETDRRLGRMEQSLIQLGVNSAATAKRERREDEHGSS
jgi:hypothetical protein